MESRKVALRSMTVAVRALANGAGLPVSSPGRRTVDLGELSLRLAMLDSNVLLVEIDHLGGLVLAGYLNPPRAPSDDMMFPELWTRGEWEAGLVRRH